MNQRFKITRSMQQENGEQPILLEECQEYFSTKPEFTYSTALDIVGAESTMTIEGDFFMWHHEGRQYPFRLYMGELYVAVVNEAMVPVIMEAASHLHGDIVEG